MVLLMMKHFIKYCPLVPHMVYSMVYPRYINLVARFALLSRLVTVITITLRPIWFGYFNLSQLTSLLSRTPSSLQNGSYMRFLVMFITVICLLFLLKLKWPKNKSVYDLVLTNQKRGNILNE